MFPLDLPQLPPDFEQFGVCVTVESSDKQFVSWVRENAIDNEYDEFRSGGDSWWLEVTLETWDDSTSHLHVEAMREMPRGGKRRSVLELSALISGFIEKASKESLLINSRARIPVLRSDIPEHGMLAELLRYSRKSCGSAFSLRGATLDIEDDVFTKLSFNYRKRDDTLFVELWAQCGIEFATDYLVRIVELMRLGADCFVFERVSREASHV